MLSKLITLKSYALAFIILSFLTISSVNAFDISKDASKGKFDVNHTILTKGLILPEPRELLQWPHERDAPHSSQGRPHRIRLHRHRPGRLGDYPFGFETALSSRPTAGRRSHQRWSRL